MIIDRELEIAFGEHSTFWGKVLGGAFSSHYESALVHVIHARHDSGEVLNGPVVGRLDL